MLWIAIALLTLACCGALLIATRGRRGPVSQAERSGTTRAFYASQLDSIDRDVAQGRLDPDQAQAARAELAREYARHDEQAQGPKSAKGAHRAVALAVPVIAVLGFGLYTMIGRADLPAQPLGERVATAQAQRQSLDQAVAQVEAQMEQTPDDVRGWRVLGPVYMETERYGEAVNAFRRVLDLSEPTADAQTNLAEALIMQADGTVSPEAMALLEDAAESDPEHIRSRFYLAGELTRRGDYARAVTVWNRLLEIAEGEEPWVATAKAGLAAAQAGETGESVAQPTEDPTGEVMIEGMVEGLAARLYQDGGSGAEWIRLVRSRLVLGQDDKAQSDFERGMAALSGRERTALEDFGAESGLTLTEQN